jgi:hypothetical protein
MTGVGKYATSRHFDIERDAFVIPLSPGQMSVDLSYHALSFRHATIANHK